MIFDTCVFHVKRRFQGGNGEVFCPPRSWVCLSFVQLWWLAFWLVLCPRLIFWQFVWFWPFPLVLGNPLSINDWKNWSVLESSGVCFCVWFCVWFWFTKADLFFFVLGMRFVLN